MTILSVGLPLLDLLQARTCKRKAWSIRSREIILIELYSNILKYIKLHWILYRIILEYIEIHWNMLNYIELYWIILNYIILELFWITLIKLIYFYNVYKLTSTPSQWLLLENRYKGSISTLAQTLSIPELFNTQGRVLSDHTHKCSPGHASTAHKRHFLGPASAGLQPFVAAPRMVPAHVQSDSVMKDTNGTKYHITWKSALLWPNLLGLFCQNPLQVTVFCCLKRTKW